MADIEISERAKNFIFLHVDSVELLEVLLLFHRSEKQAWTAQSLAQELRSNPKSTAQRIQLLKSLGILEESGNANSSGEYYYKPGSSELHHAVNELANAYKSHKHKIYELIFSPMKKARDFAEAFRVGPSEKDGSKSE